MTTARAKRLYLCNLIPLWEKDDDRLAVDWQRERATVGTPAEMRVTVRAPVVLDPADNTLSVLFDVYESDFLLTGGFDDRMASIGSADSDDERYDRRPLRCIGASEPIADADRMRFIFLSPLASPSGKNGDGKNDVETLVRAWWRVEDQADTVGSSEFYFDVAVNLGGDTMEERSDHELELAPAGAFGSGLDRRGADPDAFADLVAPARPVLEAAGWTADHATLGQEVELVARVRGALAGQTARFLVLADRNNPEDPDQALATRAAVAEDDAASPQDAVLEQFDVPVVRGEARVRWALPPLIAERDVYALRCVVQLADRQDPAAGVAAEGDRIALHARLELRAPLRLRLVDSRGKPLAGMSYTLRRAGDPEVVATGRTDRDGQITVPDLPGADYLVDVNGLAVLGASEPEYVPPPRQPKRVVISMVELARPMGGGR
ncbi:MAG TPA: prealbumin-like fold domain-containing protein [Thermoanaerobaculia bacterium]|nr:prealbumin-like fold domain-containing protein [Thermoanaerobaculia bacterium]